MKFLIMEMPHDIILSNNTMRVTGLGYYLFHTDELPPVATLQSRRKDRDNYQLCPSICSITKQLDFEVPEMFATVVAIVEEMDEVTAPEVEFDAKADFPNPFGETIDENPSFDPPHIDAIGDLGKDLRTLTNKFADSAFRSALPPELAKVPPFQIEFAELAPQLHYRHPRRLSPKYDGALRAAVDDLIRQKLAVRSYASFASPIVMAEQKDKIRMCIDFRELSGATKKMRYPLPNPSSIFQNLAGNNFFGHMDLRSGYHQLAMPEHAVNGQHLYPRSDNIDFSESHLVWRTPLLGFRELCQRLS